MAARLALPDTHPLLDYVRPDLLLLRVVSRSLILWDSVEPSEEWVLAQVPKMIQDAWAKLGSPDLVYEKPASDAYVKWANSVQVGVSNKAGEGEGKAARATTKATMAVETEVEAGITRAATTTTRRICRPRFQASRVSGWT